MMQHDWLCGTVDVLLLYLSWMVDLSIVDLGVALNSRNVGALKMINDHYQLGPTYPATNDYASLARISTVFRIDRLFPF